MDVNVNVGSKIKEGIKKNEPLISYACDIIGMAIVGFCTGYVVCLRDIIKHPQPPRDY